MKRPEYYFSILFFSLLIISAITYNIYEFIIKNNSRELYTVGTIVGIYSTSKDYGRTYQYIVDSVTYREHCTMDECANINVGRRFIVKFWSNRPDWSNLLLDKPVVNDLVPPQNGWEEIPNL